MLLIGGRKSLQHDILYQEDLKKKINRITSAWRNGCLEKMDDLRFIPYAKPPPTKMDVLPKTVLQIILDAKWLVRHLSPSLNQQRRPLPFALPFCLILILWLQYTHHTQTYMIFLTRCSCIALKAWSCRAC